MVSRWEGLVEDHHELTDKGNAQHEAGRYRTTLAASRRAGRIRSWPSVNDRSRTPPAGPLFPQAPGITHAVSVAWSRSRGLPVQLRAVRGPTRDQNPSAQRDALAAAGCDQVFIGKEP